MEEAPILSTFAEALEYDGKLELYVSCSNTPNSDMMHANILKYLTLMMEHNQRQSQTTIHQYFEIILVT